MSNSGGLKARVFAGDRPRKIAMMSGYWPRKKLARLAKMCYNYCQTTPIPQATNLSCLLQPNKILLNQPSLGRLALGLASLANGPRRLFYYPVKERRQMIAQHTAMMRVKLAVKAGKLIRLNRCEVCGKEPTDNKTRSIVAHHWNGYDDALNVWWCCRSCNGLLDVHDGSLTIEQARIYVRKRQYEKLGYVVQDDDPRLKASRW